MKKYNLSNIMKRAWEMVKKLGFGISEALKKAWKEAKAMKEEIIKMTVVRNEIFTVNTTTGEISGKTYNAKEWLKKSFDAKWNKETRTWFAKPEEIKEELAKYPGYYESYIVKESEEVEATENDEIIKKELVNRNDGFYSKNTHKSGKITYSFVG